MHSAHYDIKELGNQKRAIYMTLVQCVQKNLYHSEDVCSIESSSCTTFSHKWLRIEHIGQKFYMLAL